MRNGWPTNWNAAVVFVIVAVVVGAGGQHLAVRRLAAVGAVCSAFSAADCAALVAEWLLLLGVTSGAA